MTLKECYDALGGDYDEVIGRLRSEKLVQKFVLKFLDDPSQEALRAAMAAHDQSEAFRAAHTIKGVCLNLGFQRLFTSSNALTEALRSEWKPEAEAMAAQVAADYEATVQAILSYREALPA